MKYIHLELSNLIGRFERTMVQIYIYVGMSVVVQKSVGGITWAKRAHAQSQYWAVKSYQ